MTPDKGNSLDNTAITARHSLVFFGHQRDGSLFLFHQTLCVVTDRKLPSDQLITSVLYLSQINFFRPDVLCFNFFKARKTVAVEQMIG